MSLHTAIAGLRSVLWMTSADLIVDLTCETRWHLPGQMAHGCYQRAVRAARPVGPVSRRDQQAIDDARDALDVIPAMLRRAYTKVLEPRALSHRLEDSLPPGTFGEAAAATE